MSKSRESFEKFCREDMGWSDDDLKLGYLGLNYFWEKTSLAWTFWQVSRELINLQLPDTEMYEDGHDEWGYKHYAAAYPEEELQKALTEAGVKY